MFHETKRVGRRCAATGTANDAEEDRAFLCTEEVAVEVVVEEDVGSGRFPRSQASIRIRVRAGSKRFKLEILISVYLYFY